MGNSRDATAAPSDIEYWLALNRVKGVGPALFGRVLERFGSPAALFSASRHAQRRAGLPEPVISQICGAGPIFREVAADIAWLEGPDHHVLTLSDPRYPVMLREISRPPPLLYVDGDVACLHCLQLAMVGSRNPTRNGARTAEMFARALAEAGVTVTSGLAAGIDGACHRGALTGTAPTIAVLGTGVDHIYPYRHRDLAQEITSRGALVSEFPLGRKPLASNFPRRNRIISGLSLGVVVVEANSRSGSLITARYALEQGREVFAVPGSIHIPQSRGCHLLIRQGAKLVERIEDILEELTSLAMFQVERQVENGLSRPGTGAAAVEGHEFIGQGTSANLNEAERLLMDYLGELPITVDTLVDETGRPVQELASMLIELELKGAVGQEPGGYVRLVQGMDSGGEA